MQDNKISEQVKGTLLQDPVNFTLDIYPRNKLAKWLQKKGLLPKQKTYCIRPITYGNLQRITALFARLQINMENNGIEEVYKLMQDHSETMAKIIAIAISNSRREPSESLVKELFYNITSKEGLALVSIIMQQMDVSGFFRTIVLAKGISLSETTDKSQTGPLVPGNSSEE